MDLVTLKKIVSEGEGPKIEFKHKTNHPDRIVNEAVALANTAGGYILIGVEDSGILRGVKYPEDDLSFILNYLNQKVQPRLTTRSGIVRLTQKRAIIWIYINEKTESIYAVFENPDDAYGVVYYRVKDESIKASPELKRILRQTVKERNRTIRFGHIESAVLKSLEVERFLSIKQLMQLHSFKKRELSNCLVNLVLTKVLKIIPGQPDDLYTFNDDH